MRAYDIFYGTVTLPCGRQCKAVLRGKNDLGDYWTSGGFEIAETDPLEIEDIDGVEPDDSEYDKEYEVNPGQTITLAWYVIEQLIDHGKFEAWTPDYD